TRNSDRTHASAILPLGATSGLSGAAGPAWWVAPRGPCCMDDAARQVATSREPSSFPAHFAMALRAASIFAFTDSRLKLAPFCIGGNSIAVCASSSTFCWTNTKRQNSYLNQSKYCCAPSFVPLSGQPVRSNGSRRRLVRNGTSTLDFSPSQPLGWLMKRYL